MELLKVGLIGCGRMGVHTSERLLKSLPPGWLPLNHASAISIVDGLELTALCDVNEENLLRASSLTGISCCYTDYRKLISDIRPEILSIATRTVIRPEIITFAAENGVKGIHLEKPISRSMAECNRALDACEKNGVRITYGTLRRFHDTYRQAKKIIDSGELGELIQVSIEHGRSQLMWAHPHATDLHVFFVGGRSIEYVQAACFFRDAVKGNDLIIDDDPIVEHALVKFDNGISGIITSHGGMNTRLSCTSGTITIAADGSWIQIERKLEETSPYHLKVERIQIDPEVSATQKAFIELRDAINSNSSLSSILPRDIKLSHEALFLIALSSLRRGERVTPVDLDYKFTITGRSGDLFA